jgi:hypothetical protein
VIVPLWYLVIWGAWAFAYAALAFIVVHRRVFDLWPSLFFIGAENAIFFVVARALTYDYRHYVPVYYTHMAIQAVLLAWLTWDIARNIPSSRWFPHGIRIWTVFSTLAVGMAVARFTMPPAQSIASLKYYNLLNRSAQYTLGAMAVSLIVTILVNGIGFSLTGFRVTAAAVILQLSSFVAAHIDPQHMTRTVLRVVVTADTLIGLCVALYWLFTMVAIPKAELERRLAWRANPHVLETQDESNF